MYIFLCIPVALLFYGITRKKDKEQNNQKLSCESKNRLSTDTICRRNTK